MIIGADTNVIVRLLICDVEEQKRIITDILEKGNKFYINVAVLTELTWVLTASYHFKKQELIEAYDGLLESSGVVFFNNDIVVKSLALFINSSAGFNDCLISAINNHQDLTTATFDKKASKLSGMRLLS